MKLRDKIKVLETTIRNLRNHNKTSPLKEFMKNIKMNDNMCKFYTNLFFHQILCLLTFLQPTDEIKYWATKKSKCRNRTVTTPLEEIVIMLVRLRSGLLTRDISYRFNISTFSISNIVNTWVLHSYQKFNRIRHYMFTSRETITKHLPTMFHKLKNIRVIIDCAEFACETPSNFEQQGNTYSSYKASNTFKVLIGCTPNGGVSFVSDLFEGSISDKALVQRSKLFELLDPGDLVLADRGFDITEHANRYGVHLNIPPFLKSRERLTAEEELETKNIARQRIYIEHVVGRLKRFRLLKHRLPLNMRGILSHMVFVCACLLNFQPPILEPANKDPTCI